MRRNTLNEISGRVTHTFARVTLNKADDDHKWQELDADFFNSDSRTKIERLQNYGFTSTPHPRDDQQQAQFSEATGSAKKGPAAEAIAVFMGGQRNHPVIIGVDDRRHRPRGLKPGENAQYDDQGQMTLLKRDGVYVLSNKDTVSVRHVKKDKQPDGDAGKDFKHEGDPTAEIKITNGRIQFLIGGQIMGEISSSSFTIGGPEGDPKRRQVFRKDDVDSGGDTPVTYARKSYAV